MSVDVGTPRAADLEQLLRQIIREEAGLTPVTPGEKWHGGTLVLRGLNVYVLDAGAWLNLQDLTPPEGTVAYKDGFLANRLAELAGDVNGDTHVDFTDILLILQFWGSSNPFYDQTGEGIIDFADILPILVNWGRTACPE